MLGLNGGDIDVDVLLKRLGELDGVHVPAWYIEVYIDEIEAAARAVARKTVEIRETCWSTAVGDSWGSESGFAGEWLHVFLVDRNAVAY